MPRGLSRLPLAAKLMGGFALVVLISVGSVAYIANQSAAEQLKRYVTNDVHPRVLAIVPTLLRYYEDTGSWDGVESVTGQLLGRGGQGRGQGLGQGGRAPLLIADAKGTVVYDSADMYVGEHIARGGLAQGERLALAGKTVGYVLVGTGPLELEFGQRLNRSLVIGGIGAFAIAIVLAYLLTKSLVGPLRALRDGASKLGAGELSSRVEVGSRDEIGDLAIQFNDMADALERDERLRHNMMADISHELRTPLAVMQAQVEALKDGVFDLTIENLEPLSDHARLLTRLVSDLRDLALAEAGQLFIEMLPVQMDDLARRVIESFRSQASGRALQATSQGTIPLVAGDSQRLTQVLGNLMSNAIRHTPAGGSVSIAVRSDGHWVHTVVSDTGAGISADDLPHLFDRFYRADRARNRKDGGTGLGLAIAKQIVEAHQGTISVTSQPARGSEFTVSLPVLA